MIESTTIDYLTVGHVSCDLVETGCQAGGTVSYSGRTAHMLGCKTAVVTSAQEDFDLDEVLPDIMWHRVAAPASTTFTNVYTPQGRTQQLHSRATPLSAAHIPPDWQRAAIVHLGPVANEIDPDMIRLFSNSLVGLTPQGWMRRWDEDGRVYARVWDAAPAILPLAAAVVISEEDLVHDDMLHEYRNWSRLLILTQGYDGCTVFFGDEVRQIPTENVPELEFTGAGDIFAAAYLVRLWQTGGNPWESARFANEIASQSVTQNGLSSKMAHIHRYLQTQDS